jgi:hypothetical protein
VTVSAPSVAAMAHSAVRRGVGAGIGGEMGLSKDSIKTNTYLCGQLVELFRYL